MNEQNTATQPEKEQSITLYELDTLGPALPPERSNGWCKCDERGLIAVSGEEAESFLQGQLTQDMAVVKKGQSLLAAHCTPKGRIVFLFNCCYWRDQFYLDLPAELEAQAIKRLTMYKLRAKVTLQSETHHSARTALWGAEMRSLMQINGWDIPEQRGSTVHQHEAILCALGEDRWTILSTPDYAARLRAQLAQHSMASPEGWQIVGVRAGEPEVIAQTMDEWIPQMLNLDHLQGVSFKKGCYTGQEIVARAHFLGRVKRRMRLFAYQGAIPPEPGQKVLLSSYAPDAPSSYSSGNMGSGNIGSGNVGSGNIETTESDEEHPDSVQIVRSVELYNHSGWALAVSKIPSNTAPSSET